MKTKSWAAAGAWQASHLYAPGGVVIISGFVFFISFPTSGTATSGATAPTWVFITGDTVIDGSVIWTCQGPAGLATGIADLVFAAWDGSRGTSGGRANVSTRGGGTPFSSSDGMLAATVFAILAMTVPSFDMKGHQRNDRQ